MRLETTQERLSGIAAELEGLASEKLSGRDAERQIAQQIETLNRQIQPAEAELDRVEIDHEEFLVKEVRSRQSLSQVERFHTQAQIALARQQESLSTLRRRIEDDFGLVAFEYEDEISGATPLPLEGLVEQLPRVTSLSPDIEDSLRRKKTHLRRMGAINPEAEMEYQEVKERFEFLTNQTEDLEKAEADVLKVIAELEALMEQAFLSTYHAVAGEFSQIFTRLFGGGAARLALTDPEDLTSSGIDIEARLPGRREQGLSLLSGGERSLTATALIFALLKISPTPFCVLDEVDAMLDEANVGRFRELLRELSADTQFILITHNRNTVQAADVIYGVTMGLDSASQVLSLKLDEVDGVYAA
jgi:chromosome segregation protein